jgi:hypothetical protein
MGVASTAFVSTRSTDNLKCGWGEGDDNGCRCTVWNCAGELRATDAEAAILDDAGEGSVDFS